MNSPCSPSKGSVVAETAYMPTPPDDVSHRLVAGYQLLFERNPMAMWIYDVNTLRILSVNAAALALYGYSKQAFVGLTLLDLHHDEERGQLKAFFQLPASAQSTPQLWRHKQRNGDLIEVEVVSNAIEHDGIHARIALLKDMTQQRRAEQAQRALTEQLTIALESVTDAFFTLDRDWRFTYVNGRAEALLQRKRDELLGCSAWDKFPEWVGTICQTEWERAMAGGQPASFEKHDLADGMWRKVHVYPSAQGVTVNCREITSQRVPAQQLLEQQETLAAVVRTSNDAIISADLDGRIKLFNPGAERIFGHSEANMLGHSLEVLLPERFRAGHGQQLRRFAEVGGPSRMMGLGLVKGVDAAGQELDLEGTISQVSVNHQQVLIATFRNVTERRRAEAKVAQSQALLSELTQRLMTQEKMLVKRLAQTLHDQLGQTVAAIGMAHETILTLQADQAINSVKRLQAQMGSLISQAVRQVRQVLVDLRPPLLDERGLAEALDNELRNRSLTQPKIDFSIHVSSETALLRWPSEVEYAAFMIAREAIENALRHSGSTSVAVHLNGSSRSLQLEIADKGVGFAEGTPVRPGHLGILGMHERALEVGAALTLEPVKPQGTRVCFSWQPQPLV